MSITDFDKSVKNNSINKQLNEQPSHSHMHSLNQHNPSLLPIHEFEKVNDNFMKFKKKNRRNEKETNELQKSANWRILDRLNKEKKNRKTREYDDATSELTIGASAEMPTLHKKAILNLNQNDNGACNLKTSIISNQLNTDKDNASDVQNSIVQNSKYKMTEDDEVNYLLFEDDQMHEIRNPPKATQFKKVVKYRRNRNMRVDRDKLEKSRNYMVSSLSNNN